MIKPRIIVFAGTVGSGKSTHMKLLYSELKRRRLKVKKIGFLKTGNLLAFVLEVFLAKMLASRRKDVHYIRALVEEKTNIFKRMFRLWLFLDLLSITIKFLIHVYLPLKLGYIVLVEEYIPAAISDYIYLSRILKSPLKINSFAIRYMLKLINVCNPIHTFFFDAGNNDLFIRWRMRGSLCERGEYIQMQRNVLFLISRKLSHRFLYVNTSMKTLTEVHKLITDHMGL
ncbi:MAG: hypothetical protein RMJ07_07245 [Nitrososphaerota archaeon]|nr:hypothetical protein [Nitrososphaerota archaeon]